MTFNKSDLRFSFFRTILPRYRNEITSFYFDTHIVVLSGIDRYLCID